MYQMNFFLSFIQHNYDIVTEEDFLTNNTVAAI